MVVDCVVWVLCCAAFLYPLCSVYVLNMKLKLLSGRWSYFLLAYIPPYTLVVWSCNGLTTITSDACKPIRSLCQVVLLSSSFSYCLKPCCPCLCIEWMEALLIRPWTASSPFFIGNLPKLMYSLGNHMEDTIADSMSLTSVGMFIMPWTRRRQVMLALPHTYSCQSRSSTESLCRKLEHFWTQDMLTCRTT